MSSTQSASAPISASAQQTARSPLPLQRWPYALWKFSRPHTIIGTTCSTLGLAWLAGADLGLTFFWAWLACICGNVYIVGLNQLTDVAIDQVNKPHLPVAAGEFSPRQGGAIVALTGLSAIALALWQGPWLLATVVSSLVIGTAYSLPPIRLKRFPFWASLCILGVRGVIVNLGLFLHFQAPAWPSAASGSAYPSIPAPLWALTLFVIVFTFAIAIFKDIPDIEGDRRYNISTFTVQLGQEAVFNLARWVLTLGYLGMAIASFMLPVRNLPFAVALQLVPLALFWALSFRVNLQKKQRIAQFYQFIWVLFFLEYLAYPQIFQLPSIF